MDERVQKVMSPADFTREVEASWYQGAMVAQELELHLPGSESVVGWIELCNRCFSGLKNVETAVLTDRHLLLVGVETGRHDGDTVRVESAPLGRLRSVSTRSGPRRSEGRFQLDFAGPVFGSGWLSSNTGTVSLTQERGWPSAEAREFLRAVARNRK